MPTSKQLRDKLIDKLKELFQLDQPDLDFGFYRLMHAKSEEVTEFLEKTLPATIGEAFGGVAESRRAELQAAYEQAVATAKKYGAPEPEKSEAALEAKAALDAASGNVNDEMEVYDHLYRFFERYYDRGDFISNRIQYVSGCSVASRKSNQIDSEIFHQLQDRIHLNVLTLFHSRKKTRR